MRRFLSAFLTFCGLWSSTAAQDFNSLFYDETVRMNYIIAGDHSEAEIFLSEYRQTGKWAGTKSSLTAPPEHGPFKLQLRDSETGKVIYSFCYSSLFYEWQSEEEAFEKKRAFRCSARFPMPKKDAEIEIYERDSLTVFRKIFSCSFSPRARYSKNTWKYPVKTLFGAENISGKIDLVFVPEGFTKEEMPAFENAARMYTEKLFGYEPFKSNKDKFCVRAVFAPSKESGADMPEKEVWKNTLLDFSYNTFDIDRYVMTENYWAVCEAADSAPWDFSIVLVNSSVYGGGGIFNYYGAFPVKNESAAETFVHEFGHVFAGLGDEYEYGNGESRPTEYDYEPYEPNLTTLKDFSSKWQSLVTKGTPVPTPMTPQYKDAVGAFEGGGYTEKGIYRPMQRCLMHDLETEKFCPVCKEIIKNVIKYWTE